MITFGGIHVFSIISVEGMTMKWLVGVHFREKYKKNNSKNTKKKRKKKLECSNIMDQGSNILQGIPTLP